MTSTTNNNIFKYYDKCKCMNTGHLNQLILTWC
nr:MAG TPA: hypothetical protein [Caudoviricetes sp.]